MRTLHIVDGHSSGGTLKNAFPGAEILVWLDALYDGPVPGGLTLPALSRVRERYWGKTGELKKRDRRLAGFRKFEEVVLWFGPTMVCQLSLIQVLDWLARQEKSAVTISLIDHDYAGWLPPEKLARAFERRRVVSTAAYRLAQRAWKAFTAADPRALNGLLGADSGALPELRRVLLLLAREYPDSRSGLSRIERKLLRALTSPAGAAQLVGGVMPGETFGDSYYFDAVERMIRARNQLICFAEPFRGDMAADDFRRSRVVLTEFGRRVLAGKADAIAFNGIDRWIGGVHLEGDACPWRWSDKERGLIRRADACSTQRPSGLGS